MVACSTGKVCAHAGCGFRRKQKVGQWELPKGKQLNDYRVNRRAIGHAQRKSPTHFRYSYSSAFQWAGAIFTVVSA